MKETDTATVLRGVADARRLLGQYLAPGPRNATDTVERLLDILDDRDFVAALDRLRRRQVIRLVE